MRRSKDVKGDAIVVTPPRISKKRRHYRQRFRCVEESDEFSHRTPESQHAFGVAAGWAVFSQQRG